MFAIGDKVRIPLIYDSSGNKFVDQVLEITEKKYLKVLRTPQDIVYGFISPKTGMLTWSYLVGAVLVEEVIPEFFGEVKDVL